MKRIITLAVLLVTGILFSLPSGCHEKGPLGPYPPASVTTTFTVSPTNPPTATPTPSLTPSPTATSTATPTVTP